MMATASPAATLPSTTQAFESRVKCRACSAITVELFSSAFDCDTIVSELFAITDELLVTVSDRFLIVAELSPSAVCACIDASTNA